MPAQTASAKLSDLRQIYQYASFKTHNPRQRDRAKRFLEELSSFNYNQRQSREARAVKSDSKLKAELIKNNCYLSAYEITEFGETCFQEATQILDGIEQCLENGQHVSNSQITNFVINFLVALMLKGKNICKF